MAEQTYWRRLVARLSQPPQNQYLIVRQFGERLAAAKRSHDLPQLISDALCHELQLSAAAVYLWQPSPQCLLLSSRTGYWQTTLPTCITTSGESALFVPARPHFLHQSPTDLPSWLYPLHTYSEIEVVAPMTAQDSTIGLLVLGQPRNLEAVAPVTPDVISLLAQHAALFLLAYNHSEAVWHMPQQVSEAQERERFRIAEDLHNTIQQFLGRLPFFLEVSRARVRQHPNETEDLLQRVIVDVEQAARALRHILNDLSPTQFDDGLTRPLTALTTGFEQRTGIPVRLDLEGKVDTSLSLEAGHALYRVTQQALTNVEAHAQPRRVEINIAAHNGRIHFSIRDDGRGSSADERFAAIQRGSSGLQTMQARIHAVGGSFHFQSTPGQGTRISGSIPIQASVQSG